MNDESEYDPEFVELILWLDAQPNEAEFDNVEELLEWLNQ